MTTKSNKTFDAVAFTRKVRKEFSEKIKNMTFEEKKRYIEERIKPIKEKLNLS